MRPSATESLYKDLEAQEGVYEYNLPAEFSIRPLRLADLDQVVGVETAGFPPEERATREKLAYRLQVCPELCAGVFVSEYDWPRSSGASAAASKPKSAPAAGGPASGHVEYTEDSATNSDSDQDDASLGVAAPGSSLRHERLVAHVIATKTAGKYVTDKSMEIGGHDEAGETIAVHSVVVHPDFQGRHIGYIMVKDYVQKFFGLANAEQMALLAHDELVPFYRKHGFQDEGVSESSFGGQHWRALRLPFDTYDGEVDL